jgi:predicted kinase
MKIVAVAGLPASGKTTYALSTGLYLIDDISSKDQLLDLQRPAIVTSPFFCISDAREEFATYCKSLGHNVDWVYFENDPKQCLENARLRERDVVSSIHNLSKQ